MLGELYLNGQYLLPEQATISAFDRGFLFGEGIYEVWLVVNRRLVDMESHLKRLDRSLRESGIPVPPERTELVSLLGDIVKRNNITNGFVYLQVTPGAGERNFIGKATTRPTVMLMGQEKDFPGSPNCRNGITVDLVPDIRWLRRDIKTIMLMPQVMAKKAAVAHGNKDAIFYDEQGITEGASSNVFAVNASGGIMTRPLSHSLLPGCTRDRILTLARTAGLPVREEIISRDALFAATEVFVTSATSLVTPVIAVDGRTIADGEPGRVTRQLQALYLDYTNTLPPITG